MKEVNKRFINIHTNYSPINNNLHQHLVPSYPAPLGPLPEYGYVYYPSFEGLPPSYAPDISSCYAPDLLQRIGKPLDVSVYLPLLQEPHEIPLLDVPLNYQSGSFQQMLAFNPLPQTIQTQGVQEVESGLKGLMLDVFGNYVVQKLLEFGADEIKQEIQAKRLDDKLVECMKEQHGNHVIQKCVEKVEESVLENIITKSTGKIIDISCDPYGCRVIQRFLENANLQQRRLILNEVNPAIYSLIQDQYGNYIVQHILDHGSKEETEKIAQSICGHVVELSQHKYASNVLEKCVERTGEINRALFITEMVNSGSISPPWRSNPMERIFGRD
ncbi:pumilio homolog 2 [Eurytemora carolleeae]|uniref:pumilio homolog 2 n=1 Tax=Eurytemora carolleeae TaxID=1294199 RepID=UPI000C76F580|nr:pumilio homolog 2 [Eurytemora carolleeae]|eukprot:XP_023337579.1 pumilio homolog 2-like [Eurytemora affinis]